MIQDRCPLPAPPTHHDGAAHRVHRLAGSAVHALVGVDIERPGSLVKTADQPLPGPVKGVDAGSVSRKPARPLPPARPQPLNRLMSILFIRVGG